MRIIAGEWKGHRIQAPPGRGVRPTTDRIREAWMSALGGAMVDARVLDLFAGSGALGLETLSRGACEAVFVEKSRSALKALRRNIQTLGAGERTRVVGADVFSFLGRPAEPEFELALADPPYGRGYARRLFEQMSRSPFARELWVEHHSKETMPELPGLRQRTYGDTTLSHWETPE